MTVLFVFAAIVGGYGQDVESVCVLSEEATKIALEFSPLGPIPGDPTNAVFESEAAARFGQALFFDERLSGAGDVSCATCHDPQLSWTDARSLARGVANLPRHTMTLWNVVYNRWYFWDGRKDTLWSQALGPLEDPREHAGSRLQIAHTIASDPAYRRAFAETFRETLEPLDPDRFPARGFPVPGQEGHPLSQAWLSMQPADRLRVNRIFVNVGKSMAAFQRKLISDRAPFDVFVEGLREGDTEKQRAISASAQRGFELFQGKARCHFCHDGPNFTDLEFHSNRVPTEEGTDLGRPIGIRALQRDPFNSLSVYADDGGAVGRRKIATLRRDEHPTQEFKTPTLRNIARTAPYMHEGQIATLEEVIEFYSTLAGAAPLRPNSERLIEVLDLTRREKADLLAFLHSLSDESLPAELLRAPPRPF
jgi:cytochrome c peroxidase